MAVGQAHRIKTALTMLVVLLGLSIAMADRVLAGPMRSWAERTINANLNGYTVHIARARPHLYRLAFELDGVALIQNTHPDPPVADFGALKFSLQLASLLHFKVAGELTLERPRLHINLNQIEAEVKSQVSLKDQGWQSAVEAIYPIKLDRVRIVDGSLLYLSSGTTSKPIQLTKVFMVAQNVRNIAAAKGTYPSPVSLEGVLFDIGTIKFLGQADFLSKPFASAQGEIQLVHVPLDRLAPLAQEYQLKTTSGFLSARGVIEYTAEAQLAHLAEVLFEDLRVDYITSKATKAVEKQHGKAAVKLAKEVKNAPLLMLKVDALRLTNAQIGFVNESAKPAYRLFLSGVNLKLENLSNQAGEGRSTFQARGAFMGSGSTVVSGGFRSTASPADFDVHLKLDDANLPALNSFLQAHAGMDVAAGRFSLFTEVTVKNGRLEGYLKPLVKDLKIYDRQKDQDKRLGQRVKLHVLQFLAGLFKNHDSKAVATVIRVSGSTKDPKANEWEVIRKLLGNGLARAILPGFLTPPKPAGPAQPAPPKPAGVAKAPAPG